ncbi:MAG TPA: hypothetical protein VIK11_14380 [Tepidiformaceae bacterium]|jgi:hypothetical protein
MDRRSTPGRDDIQLEPPLSQHAGMVRAVEDRSYLIYIAGALFTALAAGFLLAVLLPLSAAGTLPWTETVPRLTQAHGWAQLQGWAGLFVAGMGLRMMPRFAGRKPLPTRLTLPISLVLFFGTAGRTVAQTFLAGRLAQGVFIVTGCASAFAMLGVGCTLLLTLSRAGKHREPWRYFASAGACWWLVWGVLTTIASIEGASNGIFIPARLDDAMTWIVMFGVVANFIWGIQSRSVPIFFGRKTPSVRRAIVPGLLLNIGVLAILTSTLPVLEAQRDRALGFGLALCGLALAWLAPLAGSLWGQAHRLRPRARAAARYVIAANWFAVISGVLLAASGIASALTGNYELFALRDAARHAFGVGVITLLIVGMAQLVAPVFALERAEARAGGIRDYLTWWPLLCAAVLRVVAALLLGHMDGTLRLQIAAVAGALGWLGLAGFAFSVIQAARKEPRMRALLTGTTRAPKAD